MIAILWSFRSRVGLQAEFEALYGPGGAWVELFSTSTEYLESVLLKDKEDPGRYLTLDRWTSREAYEKFLQARHPEYEALDAGGESLTENEELLGVFTEVVLSDPAARPSNGFLPPPPEG